MSEKSFEDLMAEPPPNPVILFGKHKGKYASQVDVEYLQWLTRQSWLSGALRGDILDHLETRTSSDTAQPEKRQAGPSDG